MQASLSPVKTPGGRWFPEGVPKAMELLNMQVSAAVACRLQNKEVTLPTDG